MASTSTSGFGSLFNSFSTRETFSSQAAWAIDPVLGNDASIGTPATPLKTMEEFSNRFSFLNYKVAGTLQLIGNVIDSSLTLNGTRFAPGASLTISGTTTQLGSGSVSSTAAIGGGWQVTTTGINWSLIPLGSLVQFSTGQSAAISEIVDTNNVIIGMIAAPGTSTTSVAPTNGSTVTALSRSRIWPFIVNAFQQGPLTATPLIIQNVSFDAASASAGFIMQGGLGIQLFACEINNHNTIRINNLFNARVCKFSISASMFWQVGAIFPTTVGCVAGGAGSTIFGSSTGLINHHNLLMTGARLSANASSVLLTGVTHIRNTAGPVVVGGNGWISNSGTLSGSVGNTGIGIDVSFGKVSYAGGGNKPTVTGTSDTRVNGITKTYAQIPFISLDATVPDNLTGNGSAIVQE